MEDLFAPCGGFAATKWKRRHAKLRQYIERIRSRRAAQDAREARWEKKQRRQSLVAKLEREIRQSKLENKKQKLRAKREKMLRKLRRQKLRLKMERDERRAFLRRRKTEGYRNPRLPYKDLTGRRFGRLVVMKPGGRNPSGSKRWWVRCDCGSPMKEIAGTNLQQGILRSCGCLWGKQAGGDRKRKRATKAKVARRKIRGALAKWQAGFCGSAGDAKLIWRLRTAVQWAEGRLAASKPHLRQLPTMKDAQARAEKRGRR